MKDFLKHINSQDIGQLKQELKELYSNYELVRDYYQIKLKQGKIDGELLLKYKKQITNALYFDDFGQGGLDVDKVDKLIKRLNSDATHKFEGYGHYDQLQDTYDESVKD